MTSRLRNKLDELEQSGRSLNESFCQIGTPLPPLSDTKKDQGEFVPIWKQEVRDEQGRRRLHGAFTGGFSAGYFNTVGSKEGWTPSTFKSSRSARAQKTQRAEDFMDEEDLEEMRQSRKLENTETFKTDGGFGGTAEELAGRGGSSVPSALSSLIQPASSSIGQKLLTKLGWRPGQGIGPRISARKRRIQEAKIQSGAVTAKSGIEIDDADHAESSKHTFAPRDTKLLVYDGKQGKEGLGYTRGQTEKLPSRAGPGGQAEMGISAGFGLGIDDADEDDLDIYHGSSNINDESHTRLSYDLGLDGDGEDVVMLGSGAGRRKPAADSSRPGRPALQESDQGNRWHDGRPVLAGFTLDPHPVKQDKWFDFPPVPPDWRPRPSRVWNRGNRWDKRGVELAVAPPTGMGLGRKPQMTADQRGEKLGEEQIKAPLKSIFEYMSEKSKERLAQFAASKQEAPPTAASAALTSDPSSLRGVEIPSLSPRTASAALMGFIPFGDDPAKQERYRSYLVSQTHNTTAPNPELLPSKSVDQINKELQDFSKSATIFKPMSFAMANRFTSSKASAQDMKQPEPGLHMPDPDRVDFWKDKAEQEAQIKELLTPKQEAARSGMYGNLTRTVENFYPNKLLCKRFGVADPHPDGPPEKVPDTAATSSSAPAAISAPPADLAWTEKYTHKGTEIAGESVAAPAAPPTRPPRTLAEVGMADDENQGRDILTYQKPPIDIFRAIFQDDDSDDNEDEDEDDDKAEPNASLVLSKPAGPLVRVSTSTTPASGSVSRAASQPTEGQNGQSESEPYRPIFQSKTKADTAADEDSSRDLEAKKAKFKAKKNRDKFKKSTKILMSFDVGDDVVDDIAWKESPKRKRERDKDGTRSAKKHRQDPIAPPPVAVDDEEDEWVEKDVLVPLAPTPSAAAAPTSVGQAGRKKASDFM